MNKDNEEVVLTDKQIEQKRLYQKYKLKYAEYQKTHKHIRDAWRKKNIEHLKEYRKKWDAENIEHVREYKKLWARRYRAKLKSEREASKLSK